METLGMNSPSMSSPRPPRQKQPATPVVIPPSPIVAPASVSPPVLNSPSSRLKRPSSSSGKTSSPYDLGDIHIQAGRRTKGRSPGTLSSPDLATMVRIAKERGIAESQNDGSLSPYPPTISPDRSRTRTRSSTSSSFSIVVPPSREETLASNSQGYRVPKAEQVLGLAGRPLGSVDGMMHSKTVGRDGGKNLKNTVRNKTSALWTRMTGQTSVSRARSNSASQTVPSTPITPGTPFTVVNTPTMFSSYAQDMNPSAHPLPLLPRHNRPSTAPAQDVFGAPVRSTRASSSIDLSKPLPPIQKPGSSSTEEEVDKVLRRDLSPAPTGFDTPEKPFKKRFASKGTTSSPIAGRRRSMSLGDVDIHHALAMAGRVSLDQNKPTPKPSASKRPEVDIGPTGDRDLLKGWDLGGAGDLNDFRGAFAGLTAISPTQPNFTLSQFARTAPPVDPTPAAMAAMASSSMHSRVAAIIIPRERSESSSSTESYVTPPSHHTTFDLHHSVDWKKTMPPADRLPLDPLTPESSPLPARTLSLRTPRTALPSSPVSRRTPRGSSRGATAPTQSQSREFAVTFTSPSHESLPLKLPVVAGRSASEPSLLSDQAATPVPMVHAASDHHLATTNPRGVRLVASNTPILRKSSQASSSASSISRDGDFSSRDLVVTKFNDKKPSPRLQESMSDEDLDTRARESSEKCWNEDETFLAKEKIAEWLGGQGKLNNLALKYYMDHFDFAGMRLDSAFRHLCSKLYVKGETQEVDRILAELGRRYWECNPNGLYGSAGIVHSVAYSLLLLNTDLHIAELSSRMSKGQFTRNTLAAILDQVRPKSASTQSLASDGPAHASSLDLTINDEPSTPADGSEGGYGALRVRTKRSGSLHSWNSVPRDGLGGNLTNGSTPQLVVASGASSPSVVSPMDGKGFKLSPSAPLPYGRAWEHDMESLLKEMYVSIKAQQISQPTQIASAERPSTSSLSPGVHSNALMRSRSQRSHSGPNDRLKRGSIRGIQSLLGNQSQFSSTSSIDGRTSPSGSFATSLGDGISASSSSLFAPTLGFASNLSHTIIKEAQEDDARSTTSADSDQTTVSISDEELALLGAPWAKEGMLCRKQYWEASGKRAKNKTWMDVFVVIQKGELSMFTFGETSNVSPSGGVGGGNWLANANQVGGVCLAHSLAHTLPPPGYNRSRPHCFVLTLASEAVYFFQAGTEDLVNEWVSTCNYWAARLSKEPLAGGVSNMEYGWNRILDAFDNGSLNDLPDPSDAFSVKSGRSKLSKKGWDHMGSGRAQYSPFGLEKIYINEWKPPMNSNVSSSHDEESQMEALQKQVAQLKSEFTLHDKLQVPIQTLYPPRSANALKAQANWEAKSKYLMAEIFKYDTYVDSLRSAMSLRLKRRGEKVLEQALVETPGEEDEALMGLSVARAAGKNIRVEKTIEEADEPATPGPRVTAFGKGRLM